MAGPKRTQDRAFCPECGQKYAIPEDELRRRPGMRFRATCRACGTAFSVRWHDGGLETDVEEILQAGGGRDLIPKGARVGKYEIEEMLSSGGSSTVYRAFELGANRTVALKVLHQVDPDHVARFRREVEVQGNLKHPNIMPIFDQGKVDGKPYYTMELLHKPTTLETVAGLFQAHRLGYNPQLRTLASLEAMMRQVILPVARAIHFANQNGVIHRDLKPSNVIVDARTLHVYVIDFGICHVSKQTGKRLVLRAGQDREEVEETSHLAMGTLRFMPPEQARGEISLQQDVWAIGGLLHYVINGDAPIAAAMDTKRVPVETRIANLRKIAASSREAGDEEAADFYERRAEELGAGGMRSLKDVLHDAQTGAYAPLRAGTDPALAALVHRAMAPDAGKRYADAGALAADLQAWLEGRPVRAYATALGPAKAPLYRARLFVRRNRNVVLAAAAALVLAVVVGIVQVARSAGAERDRLADWLEEARRSDDPTLQEDRLARILALRPDHAEAAKLLALARKFKPLLERMEEAREVKGKADELRERGKREAARQLAEEMAAVLKGSVIRDLESLPADYPGRRLLDEARDLESNLRGIRTLTLLQVPEGAEVLLVSSDSQGRLLWDEAESWGTAPLALSHRRLAPGSYVLLVRRLGATLHLPFLVDPARLQNLELRVPLDPAAVPEGMVYVGGSPGMLYGDLQFHRETRRVRVEPFFLDAREVTNSDYARYLASLGAELAARAVPRRMLAGPGSRTTPRWDEENGSWTYPPGTGGLPVTDVSLLDAQGFAAWAGKRLPTPEEWELAARGIDGRSYPFGNVLEPDACNAQTGAVAEVGSFPRDRSPFGAFDMAGNVAEWTSAGGKYQILKGGSFELPRYRAITTTFEERKADDPYPDVGFRCAK